MTLAEALARKLHADQVDKAGQPYVGHLERVVGHLLARWPDATDDEIASAWLHDALEDTAIGIFGLLNAGISPAAIKTVIQVTRYDDADTYLEWIGGIAATGNISALRVKISDNRDNSDPSRVAMCPGGDRLFRTRYEPAHVILDMGLDVAMAKAAQK